MSETKVEKQLTENEMIIVKTLYNNTQLSLTELKDKLAADGKDMELGYVSRVTNKLIDDGILEYKIEGNKKMLSVTQGIDLSETGIMVPSSMTASSPEDRLAQTLDLFNIRGDTKRKVTMLMATNPTWHNPYNLHGLLLSLKVDPSTARLISEHYFGAENYLKSQSQFGSYGGYGGAYNTQQPLMLNQYGQPIMPNIGQPQMVGMSPTGQPIIIMPQTQQQPVQQTQQQPVIIKTGETRRVKRPVKDDKGQLVKDNGQIVYEEIEEPITLVAGSGGDNVLSSIITTLIADRKGEGKESDEVKILKERLELEKEKNITTQIEQIRKESSENIQGLIGSVNKNQQELAKTFFDSVEKMQHSWEDRFNTASTEAKHLRELEAIRSQSTAGERPIVSILKEVNKTIKDVPNEVRQTVTTLYRPQGIGSQSQGSQLTPEQMAAEARRIRDKMTSTQQV